MVQLLQSSQKARQRKWNHAFQKYLRVLLTTSLTSCSLVRVLRNLVHHSASQVRSARYSALVSSLSSLMHTSSSILRLSSLQIAQWLTSSSEEESLERVGSSSTSSNIRKARLHRRRAWFLKRTLSYLSYSTFARTSAIVSTYCITLSLKVSAL